MYLLLLPLLLLKSNISYKSNVPESLYSKTPRRLSEWRCIAQSMINKNNLVITTFTYTKLLGFTIKRYSVLSSGGTANIGHSLFYMHGKLIKRFSEKLRPGMEVGRRLG